MKMLLNLKARDKYQQEYSHLYLRSISLFCFSLVSSLLKLLCCPFKEHELHQESWMKLCSRKYDIVQTLQWVRVLHVKAFSETV